MSKSVSFDFKKIDVIEFLEELDIKNITKKGNNAIFSCPFGDHLNGDRHPSANMRLTDTVFHCFSCGRSGNAVTFLSELEDVSVLKARQWLRERFDMGFFEPQEGFVNEINKKLLRIEKRKNEAVKVEEVRIIDDTEVENREIDWEFVFNSWMKKDPKADTLGYMFERGFTWQTLRSWKIGWDQISQRITIPIYDEYGNLVGIKGRSPIGELPKYKVLGGPEYNFDTYNVSKVLFGLPRVKKELKENGEWLIVVEGELNAISMHQKGFLNTVGISGKILSDYQINLIKKYASRCTFIFDEEKDTMSAAKSLEPYMPVNVVGTHDKDPADMTSLQLIQLVNNSYSPLSAILNGPQQKQKEKGE